MLSAGATFGGPTMWVEALRAGNHDGIRVTRRDVADAAANVEEFLLYGLQVPALWCHAPYSAGGPRPPRELSFGHVVGFHHDEDDHVLAFCLAIRDPRAEDTLTRIGHVSPQCARDVTIHGVRYSGLSIGHVAATPAPRQRDQRAISLSWCPFDNPFDPDFEV